METLLLVLDLIGTFVFALSGGTAGVPDRLIEIGVIDLPIEPGRLVVACVAADIASADDVYHEVCQRHPDAAVIVPLRSGAMAHHPW
jgi:hypothetical protein